MRKLFFCFIFLLSFKTFAVDPYNTLQWEQSFKQDWYEWWYYKVVDEKTNDAFFFVYGIVNPWDLNTQLKGTRAFVSAGSFNDMKYVENKYPVKDFTSRRDIVFSRIGENTATDRHIQGKVFDDQGEEFSWDLEIEKKWAFNAMGWGTRYKNLSNIYWYPAQASASMSGWIHYKGKTYRLQQSSAYQDRNWGQSFPRWWTWLVSNNFKNHPGTSFAAGGGAPKALNRAYLFDGLCIGLNHEGKTYTFRNTDADTVKMNIHWGVWEILGYNPLSGHRIQISAYAPPEKFLLLPFPTPRGDLFYDYEALTGKMRIRLWEFSWLKFDWVLIADLDSDQAGIEWGTPEKLPLTHVFENQIELQ